MIVMAGWEVLTLWEKERQLEVGLFVRLPVLGRRFTSCFLLLLQPYPTHVLFHEAHAIYGAAQIRGLDIASWPSGDSLHASSFLINHAAFNVDLPRLNRPI